VKSLAAKELAGRVEQPRAGGGCFGQPFLHHAS
jgi:hypothetical protein